MINWFLENILTSVIFATARHGIDGFIEIRLKRGMAMEGVACYF